MKVKGLVSEQERNWRYYPVHKMDVVIVPSRAPVVNSQVRQSSSRHYHYNGYIVDIKIINKANVCVK